MALLVLGYVERCLAIWGLGSGLVSQLPDLVDAIGVVGIKNINIMKVIVGQVFNWRLFDLNFLGRIFGLVNWSIFILWYLRQNRLVALTH